MIPVSVVVPVKNEEVNLAHCLPLLKGFSEVLIIDSGSTDATREIAESYGATVIDFKWNGMFPKKRNWVLRNIRLKNDWVLFLDADEYISDAFCAEINKLVATESYDGYWITYHNYFMGKLLQHGDPMRKLALFRRDAGEYEQIKEDGWSHLDMEVHEHPVIAGAIGVVKTPVHHQDYKDYSAYLNRHNAYSSWEAKRYLALRRQGFGDLTSRQRTKYRLMDSWFLGLVYFAGSYFLKFGFLDGKAGWLLAMNKMIYFFQIKIKINEYRNEESCGEAQ